MRGALHAVQRQPQGLRGRREVLGLLDMQDDSSFFPHFVRDVGRNLSWFRSDKCISLCICSTLRV